MARHDRERRATALGITAAAASAGFSALAYAASHRQTAAVDEEIREETAPPPGSPVRQTAQKLAPIGKWWTYLPAALGIAGYLVATRRRNGARGERPALAGASAVAAAGAMTFLASRAFDEWLPQPPPPPGHADRTKPVFPSGHAMGPSAVGLTAAYVLAREGRASARSAVPIAALLPLATAATRLLDEKHWASDIAGGYLGGIAVAASCLAAYEITLDRLERG